MAGCVYAVVCVGRARALCAWEGRARCVREIRGLLACLLVSAVASLLLSMLGWFSGELGLVVPLGLGCRG
jgi:hypothetical protein